MEHPTEEDFAHWWHKLYPFLPTDYDRLDRKVKYAVTRAMRRDWSAARCARQAGYAIKSSCVVASYLNRDDYVCSLIERLETDPSFPVVNWEPRQEKLDRLFIEEQERLLGVISPWLRKEIEEKTNTGTRELRMIKKVARLRAKERYRA